VKKREATGAARLSRKLRQAGPVSTGAARDKATGSHRVVLGIRPLGVATGGGDEKEMADVDEEEEAMWEAKDTPMAESETETATRTATDTETEA
jgi:hypothetical protein